MRTSDKMRFQVETERLTTQFGGLVKLHRTKQKMTQEELALASGVSRKFVIELEAGRPTCELGRSLIVASTVGIKLFDYKPFDPEPPLLPDLVEDEGSQ